MGAESFSASFFCAVEREKRWDSFGKILKNGKKCDILKGKMNYDR